MILRARKSNAVSALIGILAGLSFSAAAPHSMAGSSSSAAPSGAKSLPPETCTSAREYITALEYLRDQKIFGLNEPQAREWALKVSDGCSGSAGRFIRTSKLLLRAEIAGPQVAQISLEISRLSDERCDAFIRVFGRAWSSDQLDLTASDALSLAKTVAQGTLSAVDFEKIIDYCVSPQFLDLPRHRCSELGARVAESAIVFAEKPGKAAARFIEAYRFSLSSGGPQLSAKEAMQVAEELTQLGPEALENFSRSYKYAVAPKGLAMSRAESLAFARKLARSSLKIGTVQN